MFIRKSKYTRAIELVERRIAEYEVMEEQCGKLAESAVPNSVEQKLNLGYAQMYKARKESYLLMLLDLKNI